MPLQPTTTADNNDFNMISELSTSSLTPTQIRTGVENGFNFIKSITNYGTLPNLTTDSTSAFLMAQMSGGMIYIPDGTYKANIVINSDSIFVGESLRNVIIEPYDINKPVISIDRTAVDALQHNFGFIDNITFKGISGVGIGLSLTAKAPAVIKDMKLGRLVFKDLDTGIYTNSSTAAGEIYQLTADVLYFERCTTYAMNCIDLNQSTFNAIHIDDTSTASNRFKLSGNNNKIGHLYTSGGVELVSGNGLVIDLLRFEAVKASRLVTNSNAMIKYNMTSSTIKTIMIQTCGESGTKLNSVLFLTKLGLVIGEINIFGTNYITYLLDNLLSATGSGLSIGKSDVITQYSLPSTYSTLSVVMRSKKLNLRNILHTDGNTYDYIGTSRSVKRVDTLADLRAIIVPDDTVHATGYYTKGDGAFESNNFEWDSTSVEDDNGGTIIKLTAVVTGRYKLKINDYINIKVFGGMEGPNVNNSPYIQSCEIFCYTNGKSMRASDGTYGMSDEVKIRCNFSGVGLNTIFRPNGNLLTGSIITKYKTEYNYGKSIIAYEATINAMFNLDEAPDYINISNFRIESGVYTDTDAKLSTIPNVTGFRGVRKDGVFNASAFNRSRFQNIYVNGVHTCMDITGFILEFDNVLMRNSKIGLVGSELNNVNGVIKMENVRQPFNLYDCGQFNLTSFLNEGGLTWLPSEFDRVTSFKIDGMYLEGGQYDESLFNFGMRIPYDTSIAQNHMLCTNVSLLDSTNVIQSNTKNKYTVKCDYVDGITISGRIAYINDNVISYTNNTTNIDITGVDKTKINYCMTYPQNTKYINYIPNHDMKYFSNGTMSGVYNSHVGVTLTHHESDNGIKPVTGDKFIKVTKNTASTSDRFNIELRSPFIKNYFKTNDTITVGVWVYVPLQDYDVSTTANNVYIAFALQDVINGTSYSTQRSIRRYDEWVFTTVTATVVKETCDLIIINMFFSNGITKNIGQYFYIDSIYLINGTNGAAALYDGNFENNKSPFGYDNGKSMTYSTFGQTSLSGFYTNTKIGDLINNWNSATGAYEYLYVTSDSLRMYQNTYTYKGIPAILPTSNNGVGTVWNNAGVITIGS